MDLPVHLAQRRLGARSLAVAAIAVALLALVPARASAGARVGEAAPGFALPNLAGGETSLASLRGRVVCLDFWATWCGACENELPELASLGARYRKDGVKVLAVSIDAQRDKPARYVAERLAAAQRDGAIEVLHDASGDLFATYGAEGMPALYLIDREGTVRAVSSGYSEADFARFAKQLSELVGGAAGQAGAP